jgi:nitroreductase
MPHDSGPEPPEWQQPDLIPLEDYREYPVADMRTRALEFYQELNRRRTVREFSSREVPRDVLEHCLLAAGTAPSGAHRQPWRFVVVSDPGLKKRIREAAELEEQEFYESRAPEEWLEALAPLGTDARKPFLETAPCLIAIFAERFGLRHDGFHVQNYYVSESVGIATGMLIAALHRAGLATLTHTPSPMGFLNELLDRPKNERPFLLLVVGFPDPEAKVPNLTRKPLDAIADFR